MTIRSDWLWRLARWLFALFYLLNGVHMLLVALGLAPRPQFPHTPAGAAFHAAMTATGFLDPAIALAYIAAGSCLLFQRTAPLGILLLAPLMVVIFLFNLLLSPTWIWGTVNTLWLLALAWHHRAAYRPLWNHPAAARA